MKNALILLLLQVLFSSPAKSNDAINFTVKITGVPEAVGALEVGLLADSKQLMGEKVKYRVLRIPAQKGQNLVTFANINPGFYAVYCFHDKNNNLELDENWRGVPQEAFGFSGRGFQLSKQPSFQELIIKASVKSSTTQVDLVQMD